MKTEDASYINLKKCAYQLINVAMVLIPDWSTQYSD